MLIRLEVADKYSCAAFPKPFPTVPETAGRKAAQVRLKGTINRNLEVIKMKEYQYLIGKIIVAVAIIVAAIIIAQAIGGAGESIRSGLLQLGDAVR